MIKRVDYSRLALLTIFVFAIILFASCRSPLSLTDRRYRPGFYIEERGRRCGDLNSSEAASDAEPLLSAKLVSSTEKFIEIGLPVHVALPDTLMNVVDTSVIDSKDTLAKRPPMKGLKVAAIGVGALGLTSMAVGDAIGLGANGTLSEATTQGLINGLLFIGLNILGFFLLGIGSLFLLLYLLLKKR